MRPCDGHGAAWRILAALYLGVTVIGSLTVALLVFLLLAILLGSGLAALIGP